MKNNKIGRVIRILSGTEIIVNIGSDDGASYGQTFEVYEPGENIKDPENEKINLGPLDYIKANVEITRIFPKFSIMQDIEVHKETRSRNTLSAFSSGSREVTIRKAKVLNVNKDEVTPLKINNKNISIGDPVRY
ncbi:hypothetical protein [Apilactobacillus micheneri]|uniref:hypothetical protein n=1 Tax=Apilactobacillus micheneri TaxID=1899430 RepID=UPI00112EEBFC|nr:hypothetical protein [Apilactobacillus micheneri]TPR40448.1 hypothetical protein DY119_01790 [Apilactobacillus micheneri]